MSLLKVEGLTKKYDKHFGVEDLTFTLNSGEILGLVGPNGAGKSTSIKALLGLIQPERGQVLVGPEQLSIAGVAAKQMIGYIPEFPVLYSDLTVSEHARFLGMAYGIPEPELRAYYGELVERFHLEGKEDKAAVHLSKGMEQKLSMLCALIHRPRILIADEPFNGLDPQGQREFKDLLRELANKGGGVLLCTHQLDTAERVCDRFLILNQGRQAAVGTLPELQAASGLPGSSLEDVFLALTGGGKHA